MNTCGRPERTACAVPTACWVARKPTDPAQAPSTAPTEQQGEEIIVTGQAEHLGRRVEDWLKREARREVEKRAYAKAELLGKRISHITIRDARSRWGSCSPKGRLSFSWRLIMAPRSVIDYVVAHEIAHLVEKNHGFRFWRLVATLTDEMTAARTWLKRHGEALHRFG